MKFLTCLLIKKHPNHSILKMISTTISIKTETCKQRYAVFYLSGCECVILGEFDDWSTSYCDRVGVCEAEFDDGSESESVCRTLADPGATDRTAVDSSGNTSIGGYTCGRCCCCANCSSFSALLILAELGVLEADRR